MEANGVSRPTPFYSFRRFSMRQREVQDAENVQWTCVQALTSASSAAAKAAAGRLEGPDGKVLVVCTPNVSENTC